MSSNLTHEEIYGTVEDQKAAPKPPLPDWKRVPWRQLQKGEIIKKGDYVDGAANGWKDGAKWQLVEHTIGKPASCPRCPAHALYRRLITDTGGITKNVVPGPKDPPKPEECREWG